LSLKSSLDKYLSGQYVSPTSAAPAPAVAAPVGETPTPGAPPAEAPAPAKVPSAMGGYLPQAIAPRRPVMSPAEVIPDFGGRQEEPAVPSVQAATPPEQPQGALPGAKAPVPGVPVGPETTAERVAKNIPEVTRGFFEPIVGSVETVVQGLENLLSIPERLIKHGDVTSGPQSWWGISDKVKEAGNAFLKGSQLGIPTSGEGDEYVTMPGKIIGGLAGFAPMMMAGGGGGASTFLQKFATNLMTFGLVDSAKTTAQGHDPAAMLEAAKGSIPSAVLFTVAQSLPFAKVVSNPYLVRQLEGLATGTAMMGASAIGGDRDPVSLAVQFGVGYGTHMFGTRGQPQQELMRRWVDKFKKDYNLSDDEFKEVMDVFQGKVKEDPNAPAPDPAVAEKVQQDLQTIAQKYGVDQTGESAFGKTPEVSTLTPEAKKEAIFGGKLGETIEGQAKQADAVRALVPQIGDQARAERFYDLYQKGDADTALKEFPEMATFATEQQKAAAITPAERVAAAPPAPMSNAGQASMDRAIPAPGAAEATPGSTPLPGTAAPEPTKVKAPPPEEPPSSAPARAGGGTVGLSPTPAGEAKPKADIPEPTGPMAPMGRAGAAAENLGRSAEEVPQPSPVEAWKGNTLEWAAPKSATPAKTSAARERNWETFKGSLKTGEIDETIPLTDKARKYWEDNKSELGFVNLRGLKEDDVKSIISAARRGEATVSVNRMGKLAFYKLKPETAPLTKTTPPEEVAPPAAPGALEEATPAPVERKGKRRKLPQAIAPTTPEEYSQKFGSKQGALEGWLTAGDGMVPGERAAPETPGISYHDSFPRDQIQLNPDLWQHKLAETGAGQALSHIKNKSQWDAQAARETSLYRYPDGHVELMDGHSRITAGDRVGVSGYGVRIYDGNVFTVEEARATAALTNIRQGTGTVVDSAKGIRDFGFTLEDLAQRGVDLNSEHTRIATGLANLSDPIFTAVAKGDFPAPKGAIIGEQLPGNPDAQEAIYKLIQKKHTDKNGNISISDEKLKNDIRFAEFSKVVPTRQPILGEEFEDFAKDNLVSENSDLMTYAAKKLANERSLFKTVSAKAQKLIEAGNKIKPKINEKISNDAAIGLAVLDKAAFVPGSKTNLLFKEFAAKLQESGNKNQVKEEFYARLPQALEADRDAAGLGQSVGGRVRGKVPAPAAPGELPTGPGDTTTKYSVKEAAPGLSAQERPTSKLETRLTELQSEYPDIDRDKASQVLRSFPKAENDQVANMVADPEMFNRVVQGTLSAVEQKKFGGMVKPGLQAGLFEGGEQGKPGGGRLFNVGQEAAFTQGLTTEQIQSRLGENGTVSEMGDPGRNNNRGWIIRLKNEQMVMVFESKDGSLELRPGAAGILNPEYEALGISFEPGKSIIAGSHQPVSFGSVIELARGEGPRTFDHETWHMIEHWLLTDKERAAVAKKYGDNEELRAQAYAEWNPKAAPDTIFQKILDFFKTIIKSLTGHTTAEDVFAAARSGELFGREPVERKLPAAIAPRKLKVEDAAETRQGWIERGETPSFKQFKGEMDKDNEALYQRYIMPGSREIPLYQGERFTNRAGNQIIDEKGKKRFLSKQEIYERFYDPKRPLQQPGGTEAVGRNPLLPPEGALEPPPNLTVSKEVPGKLAAIRRNWTENMSIRKVSELSDLAHTSVVRHLGWAAREMEKAVTVLGKYDKLFKSMSREDLMAFTDKAEMGQLGQVSPELQEAAQAWRRLADGLHFLIADSKGGEFAYWRDWFPRMFKDPAQAEAVIEQFFKSHGRSMTGPEGMLKARTQLLLSQSVKPVAEGGLGLELAHDNYVDMMKAKVHESLRYLTGTYIKNDYIEAGFLQKRKFPGWVELKDKSLRGYYAHPDVARVLDNFLSKGLRGNAIFDAIDKPTSALRELFVGLSAFHGFFTTLSDLSQGVGSNLPRAIGAALTGQFGAAGHHLKEMAKAMNTPRNLLEGGKLIEEYRKPGTHPELAARVDLMERGGIRVNASEFAKMSQAFEDALRESKLGLPRQVIRGISRPIMNYFVPRIKINAIDRRLSMELERFRETEGRTPTFDEETKIAQEVARESDNIYGQMVYDNLGMKRALRDILRIWIGFPGWNIGSGTKFLDSLRGVEHLIGQGGRAGADIMMGRKPSYEPMTRMQRLGMEFYLGMTLVNAVAGALVMKLLTGNWPTDMKDVFMPQTGGTLPNGQPERVRMPSYMRDILSLNHPIDMVAHKTNFPIRMFQTIAANQDYFGEQIRDPWATGGEQVKQTLKYFGKSFLPFGAQGMLKAQTHQSKALNLVGITPVPREYSNTPAQNIIDEYNKLNRATTTTKESAEKKKLKADLMKMARDEDQAGFDDMATDAIAEGKITKQQVQEIVNESHIPAGLTRFTKLPLEWAVRAFEAGSDYEKEQWQPYILKKVMTEKPENLIKLREPVVALLQEMGLTDLAEQISELSIPEKGTKVDTTGLGILKEAPTMGGPEAVETTLEKSVSDRLAKLEANTTKRSPVNPTVRTKEKKNPFKVFGL
jgi:hypothetical protein